jgi:hypothetical protein
MLGEVQEVKEFLAWFQEQPHRLKLIIAGNHDVTFQEEYYDDHWNWCVLYLSTTCASEALPQGICHLAPIINQSYTTYTPITGPIIAGHAKSVSTSCMATSVMLEIGMVAAAGNGKEQTGSACISLQVAQREARPPGHQAATDKPPA